MSSSSRLDPPERGYDLGEAAPDEAVELLAEEGFDLEFGARPLRRTIQRRLDNELASMVLSGSLNPGNKVIVGAEEGRFTVEAPEGLQGEERG